MRVFIKLALCATFLALYVGLSKVAGLLAGGVALRKRRARLIQIFSRVLLRLFGIRPTVLAPNGLPASPVLLVCNHVSYLDVLILSAQIKTVFVTSQEVHDTPVLGTLCRAGGSRFVERRNRSFLIDEIATISRDLQDGFTVCVFPEGTTGDGSQVLPFRRSLLEAAQKAAVPVVPAVINYRAIDGRPLGRDNRDLVFYYGDARFFPHLRGVLSTRSIEVDVEVLNPLSPEAADRKQIARLAQHQIEAGFTPVG